MGNATLEAKLIQQIIDMSEMVLRAIFHDLLKFYDALYRDRCLDILTGYIVGPRTLRILRTYWVRIQMAAKSGSITGLPSRSTVG